MNDIENYRLIPPLVIKLTAIVLPWLELVCAVLLILNRWVRPTALILIGLNIVFMAAISSALIRGLDIECGCFSGDSNVGVMRLVEDAVLLAAAVLLYRLERTHPD
ncbi:MAG: MauE/DoxX family redox-associated membrane protein [candidate division KSB1 bacterium]|nr:MauE/DoxX family redox-associated membrane protein [candidate division KSB1 bacterium]